MKEKILFAIFNRFDEWSTHLDFACRKGCSLCCTQNVTITALEGHLIHRFIQKRKPQNWLSEKLVALTPPPPPKLTANTFAAACISGTENIPEEEKSTSPCPFLEENHCSIYLVRPFSCRCFGSLKKCTPFETALLPEYYLSASTMVLQVLEHLSQNSHWGTLVDVLRVLAELPTPGNVTPPQTLMGQPLSGFMMPEKEADKVQEFLEHLLSTGIGSTTLEQLLNSS